MESLLERVTAMQQLECALPPSLQQLLRDCPLPGSTPLEIHGARALGFLLNDEYLFHGARYVLDPARDVLVREDVRTWLALRQAQLN